ncbi:MAG: VanZ family protein [Planctomycetaceae bacterium]|nr:VanZ family protein [Planctomycetaceae bacterium]
MTPASDPSHEPPINSPTQLVIPNPRMLQLAGVATLSLCLLIAVFGLRSGRDETILKSSIQTSGHFVFFAALAFCSAIASPVLIPWLKSRRWPQYLVGFTTSTTVGGLLELAQKFIPGRDSSIQDFVFDVTGAIFAISLLALLQPLRQQNRPSTLAQLSAALILLTTLTFGMRPFVSCALDYRQRQQALPLLLNFQKSWSSRFLTINQGARVLKTSPPSPWAGDDTGALIRIQSGTRYPGVGMNEPYPDWQAYEQFAFDIYSQTDQVAQIRIQDLAHNNAYYDRFNQSIPIKQGFQTVRIPLDQIKQGPRERQLDLSHVDGFKLFFLDPPQDFDVYLGNFRLE